MSFKYALVNRPAAIGSVPKVQFDLLPRPPEGQPHHEMARHGIMVTEYQLTNEEVKAFELAPLIDCEQIDWLASKIANTMQQYCNGYLEMLEDKPELFYSIVMQRVNTIGSGVYYSIGCADSLVNSVVKILQKYTKSRKK